MKINNAISKLKKAGASVKIKKGKCGIDLIAEFPGGEFIKAYWQDPEGNDLAYIYQSSHRSEETYKDQLDFSAGCYPRNISQAIRLALNK